MKRQRLSTWIFLAVLALSCRPSSPPPALEPAALPRQSPGIHEQTASLPGGGTLRYTISVPSDYDAKRPAPLVVSLHYGGDVTPFYGRGMIDDLVGPAFKDLGAVMVAPDSLGGDWETAKNEQAVLWLTQSVQTSYGTDPKRVVLTGYSMGAIGAWYIGSRHQDIYTAVIPVEGEPAGTSTWKVPVYVIHSQKDEVLPLSRTQRYVDELKAKGANVELHVVQGLTHYQTPRYQNALAEAVPWLRHVWGEPNGPAERPR